MIYINGTFEVVKGGQIKLVELKVKYPVNKNLINHIIKSLYYYDENIEEITYKSEKLRLEVFGLQAHLKEKFQSYLDDLIQKEIKQKNIYSNKPIKQRESNNIEDKKVIPFEDLGYCFDSEGQVTLSGYALEVYENFKDIFISISKEEHAKPKKFPNLINNQTLKKCDYFNNFPQNYGSIYNLAHNISVMNNFVNSGWEGSDWFSTFSIFNDTSIMFS